MLNNIGNRGAYDCAPDITNKLRNYELASSKAFINSTSFSTPSIGIAL